MTAWWKCAACGEPLLSPSGEPECPCPKCGGLRWTQDERTPEPKPEHLGARSARRGRANDREQGRRFNDNRAAVAHARSVGESGYWNRSYRTRYLGLRTGEH